MMRLCYLLFSVSVPFLTLQFTLTLIAYTKTGMIMMMINSFVHFNGCPPDPALCLQCFDAVGWVAERASGLQKPSGEVLV